MSTQVWVLVTDLSCHQVHFPRPGNDPCVMYLSIWSIARTFFLKPILVSFWLAKNKTVGNTILIDWRVVDIAWSPTNQRPGIQNTFRLQFTFLNCTCAAPILWYLDKIMSNHQISKEKDENCMANICYLLSDSYLLPNIREEKIGSVALLWQNAKHKFKCKFAN